MKVLLIHHRFARMGGLEQRLFNYIEYFQNVGAEVHVACRKVNRSQVPKGVIVHQFPVIPFPSIYKRYRFNERLKKWNKPHFDFELSLERTSIQKNVLAPSNHKGYLKALGKTHLSKDDLLQISLDEQAFHTSEKIFACSDMIKNELVDLYQIPESKIKVVYPPYNFSKRVENYEDQAFWQNHFQLPQDKIYHLFISTSHERKGLPLLLEVFEELENTNHILLVVGHPSKSNLKNVIDLGYLSNTSPALSACDTLVHPAIYEPFGQIITEALAHNKLTLVSTNVGAKEIIATPPHKIIPFNNKEEWFNVLSSVTKENTRTQMQDLKEFTLTKHMKLLTH